MQQSLFWTHTPALKSSIAVNLLLLLLALSTRIDGITVIGNVTRHVVNLECTVAIGDTEIDEPPTTLCLYNSCANGVFIIISKDRISLYDYNNDIELATMTNNVVTIGNLLRPSILQELDAVPGDDMITTRFLPSRTDKPHGIWRITAETITIDDDSISTIEAMDNSYLRGVMFHSGKNSVAFVGRWVIVDPELIPDISYILLHSGNTVIFPPSRSSETDNIMSIPLPFQASRVDTYDEADFVVRYFKFVNPSTCYNNRNSETVFTDYLVDTCYKASLFPILGLSNVTATDYIRINGDSCVYMTSKTILFTRYTDSECSRSSQLSTIQINKHQCYSDTQFLLCFNMY